MLFMEAPMKSLIIGGTGFIGRNLSKRIGNPIIAGRSLQKIKSIFGEVEARKWDKDEVVDPTFFNGVDTVYNLAGESVFGGRWNDEKKKRIRNSRIDGTRHLIEAIAEAEVKPKVLINSSAVGIYGSRGEEELTEQSAPENDFLAQVCQEWEREALRAEEFGVRVVLIRTGLVLGNDGGALKQMLLPFKLGVGGKIGSGKQYMPWIHIDDMTDIMLHTAEHSQFQGPVNAVAPNPVTNSEFTRTLAAVLHRPAIFSVPGFVLEITMGEFASALLGSQRVLPKVLQREGFTFTYPDIQSALNNLL